MFFNKGTTNIKITKKLAYIVIFIYAIGSNFMLYSFGNKNSGMEETEVRMEPSFENSDTAVLAGGCFWGMEAVYENLHGVLNVDSGYSGGEAETAFYKMVGSGGTGHAEAVKIEYDPQIISYKTLLEIFFMVAHDPTQLNFQGPDVGTEYRSAIFFGDENQESVAKQYIRELDKNKTFKEPIVTEAVSLDEFYKAEDYHQDFLRLNPTHPYIIYWDLPKIRDLEKKYPDLLSKP